MRMLFLPAFLVFVFAICKIKPITVFAQSVSTSTVSATLKLSVCGDGIVETPEECEGSDLNGSSCELAGYGTGSLACDIACEFDTNNCIAPTTTTALTPTPTTAVIPSSNSISSTQNISELVSVATDNLNEILYTFGLVNSRVLNYDFDGDGLISRSDLKVVVGSWVENSFKSDVPQIDKCDFDESKKCDMIDFSILMYYIDRRVT